MSDSSLKPTNPARTAESIEDLMRIVSAGTVLIILIKSSILSTVLAGFVGFVYRISDF